MYWLIKRNNTVLDAVDVINWVRWDTAHKMLFACKETDAQGLTCLRNGMSYHVAGKPALPDGYDTVNLVEVSKSVYEEEKARLNAEQKTIQELNEKVAELQTQLASQKSDITDCEDAIVELGELVGGK